MNRLVSIVYKPQDASLNPDGYTRLPLSSAQLVAGHGIEGDTKGGGTTPHVNIMSAHVMASLAEEGFLTQPGQLGEQLIVEGLDVNTLSAGDRLQIGAEACVEIVEPRTGCGKFEKYQEKLRQEASGRLGMIAKVVTSGAIALGDDVSIVG